MPIQFPDFQRISFDEANPWLVGAERGQKFAQSSMQFPQDLMAKMLANQIAQVQAKYAEPITQQYLTKSIQANQWNPKIWQSEIGLRGAEAGKMEKETQWYDKEAAARIGLQNAQAQGSSAEASMNQMKLNYLSKMLGNGGNAGSGPSMQGDGMTTGNTSSGGSTNSPSTAPSRYGIETPSPTQDDIGNKVLFGIDTFTPRQQQSYQRQQKQNDMFTKQIAESVQNANSAQKARQALSIFNNAMDKANFTGEYWGTTPSSGWRTAVHPMSDFSNEQIADNAVANLIPGAMAEIKEAMGAGKFSVIDMQAAQQMKVSRTMNKESRKSASNFMNGIFSRMDEQSKFYQTVGNPNAGVDKNTADLLWQNYQNDFPVYDKNTSSFNPDNLNNWPLYTTPKAIASVKATGTYKPTDAEKNSFMMQVPDGKGGYVVAPIKRGKVESAFRKGAKPL